jgi:hypothetical protein
MRLAATETIPWGVISRQFHSWSTSATGRTAWTCLPRYAPRASSAAIAARSSARSPVATARPARRYQ